MIFSEIYEVKLNLSKAEYERLCEGLNWGCSYLNKQIEKINKNFCINWTKNEDRVNANAEIGVYEYQKETIRELITKIHDAWKREIAIHNATKALKEVYSDLTPLKLAELLKER